MRVTQTVYVIAAATPWLAALAWCDWKSRRLPNRLTLGGAAAILAWHFGWGGVPALLNSLIGGAIAGGLLLIPFLIRAAGAGDVKYIFAGGLLVGFPAVLPMLMLTSLFGLALGIVMQIAGALDGARVKHLFRCLFDWRYDRAEGRRNLPDRENEKVRVPFGVAISAGVWTTLLLRLILEYSR